MIKTSLVLLWPDARSLWGDGWTSPTIGIEFALKSSEKQGVMLEWEADRKTVPTNPQIIKLWWHT